MNNENTPPISTALKATYIAAAATIIAAFIAGAFTLFGLSSISTQGNCSGVFTGEINDTIEQDCSQKTKP